METLKVNSNINLKLVPEVLLLEDTCCTYSRQSNQITFHPLPGTSQQNAIEIQFEDPLNFYGVIPNFPNMMIIVDSKNNISVIKNKKQQIEELCSK